MNYAELVDAAQSIAENTLPAELIAQLVRQTEQKIYNSADLPVLRDLYQQPMEVGTPTYPVPEDVLYVHHFAVFSGGLIRFLLPKDPSFIREAYPDATATGRPRHYAFQDDYTFLVGPTPDEEYVVDMLYARYPESIVTARHTWLGDNFDTALLNGLLVEVARHLQSDEDVIQNYDKLYLQAITLLKQNADGRLRQDSYRTAGRTSQVD